MMLFSEDNFLGLKQLQEFLPFGSTYDYDRVLPLLSKTELQYIKPLLGDSLHERLIKESETLTSEIRMCQEAVANITMFQNFAVLNTNIQPSGFTHITGENTGRLYKYQETELKNSFRKNGFDSLDIIVEYFLTNIERFPEFEKSTYFTSTRKQFVSSRLIVSKYYKDISNIVFHHLTPFFQRAETLDITGLVDLAPLREAMTIDPIPEDKKQAIEMVQAIIVLLGIAYAIEDRGINIFDTGVWLESKLSGDGLTEQNTLSLSDTERQVSKYRQLAERYKTILTKAVGGEGYVNTLIRDNNGKKTHFM